MDNIFKRTSAHWVRYDKYEWKESTDGVLYLTPAKEAVMSLYNPIKEYEELVLTALGIGLDVMQKKLLHFFVPRIISSNRKRFLRKITSPTSFLLTRSLF